MYSRKKLISALLVVILLFSNALTVNAEILGYSEDFEDASKVNYFGFEGSGFVVKDGEFVSANDTQYNAAYFGEYADKAVFEFDFKDNGGGSGVGGASIRVSNVRYDVQISSDAAGEEKLIIWKGGPNKVASNLDKTTGVKTPSIPVGEKVNVKIALDGKSIKVYIDNELCLDYTDEQPYTTGGFGFRSVNANLTYDNAKIYNISELDVSANAPVDNPKTGDDFPYLWYMLFLFGSIIILVAGRKAIR
jgi:hypothetical protein